MCRKKTQEEFVEEIKQRLPHIIITGEYKTARKPIEAFCTKHNYTFSAIPGSLLKSHCGCKYCGIEYVSSCKFKGNERFLSELSEKAPNVEPLEEYVSATTKISVKCKKCGHTWKSRPDSLLHGNECKKCAMRYVQNLKIKSHEQFMKEIEERNANAGTFVVLGKYEHGEKRIDCKCLKCGRHWMARPQSLVTKNGSSACPYCFASKGETRIRIYFDNRDIEYVQQKTFPNLVGDRGVSLRYDFYLPSYNLLIEYQGQFHDHTVSYQTDEEFDLRKRYDKYKRDYARTHNIELFEIWYWDFDRIEEILNDKLYNNSRIQAG